MSKFQDYGQFGVGKSLLQTPLWGILYHPLRHRMERATGPVPPGSSYPLSFVPAMDRNAGRKEEAGEKRRRKRFIQREEGEHFFALNWHDNMVVGLD